jgi:putative transposase
MPEDRKHKGWHSRGYLPHLDAAEVIQAITFRLADALPRKVIDGWKRELERAVPTANAEQKMRERIARFEDAGHGCCVLRNPSCAEIVQDALLHFDGERYRLLEWCVMPNHVHVLVHCPKGALLGELVKSWKIHSSREINRMLGRKGSLWAMDY